MIIAVLTVTISYIFFPLIFIGPIIGGFISSYPGKGYEDYDKMDKKDGAVIGAVSGLIGGLIISLLFLLGFGNIFTFIGLIYTNMGIITGIIKGLNIINVTVNFSLF